MPFPVGAAIAGGASILGGIFGMSGQSSANQVNREIAREQMRFQKDMSDTAYQRAVRDLELAGLNPALAYSQGGASTPGGATTKMENVAAPLAEGISSAGGVAFARAAQQAQIKNLEAQTTKTNVEAQQIALESKLRVGELSKRVQLTDARGARELLMYHFENETYRDRVMRLGFLSDIASTDSAIRLNLRDYLNKTLGSRIELVRSQLRLTTTQAKQLDAALGGLENIEELQDTSFGKLLSWLTAARHALFGGSK